MKKKYNFIVINFFRVTNPYSGASEVSYNFFKNIPSKNKKLIQLSDIQQKENQIETIIAKSKIDKHPGSAPAPESVSGWPLPISMSP